MNVVLGKIEHVKGMILIVISSPDELKGGEGCWNKLIKWIVQSSFSQSIDFSQSLERATKS